MPAARGRPSGRSGGTIPDRLSRRWAQIGPSPYPWEQSGLDHIRGLMPDVAPYRAVALFTFTAFSGRVSECDLFIAVPGGLYLLELKGHPGRLTNRGSEWTFRDRGTDGRVRNLHLHNPLHAVEMKSRDLRSRLTRAADQTGLKIQIPRVEAAVLLSDENLTSELDDGERPKIYGRDDRNTGLPKVWDDLLARPPAREQDRITEAVSDALPALFHQIGVSAPQAHLRYGDEWRLAGKPLDQGPTWEDRLARREDLVKETGRVRIYLTELGATREAKTSVWRAAEREYQVLQGLRHRGIAEARDLRHHSAGPAILFRHDESDLRLDQYLSVYGESLPFEARIDMVRQLAEAVRYAHRRSLYHRALAARSVYVSAKEDGTRPVLRIIDWQTAARDFSESWSPTQRSLGRDAATSAHLENSAAPYLAPEFKAEFPDPASLDVFGLGAVAYLILTGEPPATGQGPLLDRLVEDKGLHPGALLDGFDERLDGLVYAATRYDADDRLPDVESFLDQLTQVERGTAPAEVSAEAPTAYVNPLEARPGEWVSEELCVKALLGTGGTGRALLVERMWETDEGEVKVDSPHVVKVALNEADAAERLRAEAAVLRKVGGGQIVRLQNGPRELGGHTAIEIQFAGDRSLASVLREDGKLPYVRLKNLSGDLFHVLLVLEREEVMHRDIKPDNLGVFRIPRNDERELLLFDFSLATARPTDVASGTGGYLDPFLGTRDRPRYDEQAERYAVAVTLHQMASGEKPIWGTGGSDPKALDDQVPNIASSLFNPSLSEGLTTFFARALHRDADRRFDSAREMLDAWNRVFVDAERTAPPAAAPVDGVASQALQDQRDAAAAAAGLDTALDVAGLSPTALEAAHVLDAATVGQLLAVPQWKVNRVRGAGTLAKRELNRRYREWAKRLRPVEVPGVPAEPSSGESAVQFEHLTVDAMAADLIRSAEATVRRKSSKVPAIRAYLGLVEQGLYDTAPPPFWPTQSETAGILGLAQSASVNQYVRDMAAEWRKLAWLTRVREELGDALAATGRVMTVRELAAELRTRAGAQTDDQELALRYAAAVTRAALEAERCEPEPRFTESRRAGQIFAACESLPGASAAYPAKDDLVDYAAALGVRADEAVLAEPLPGPAAVRLQLRAVRLPEGMPPLPDARLVTLAAAASRTALASPRLDLYPRDLELERALRISQAAAGVADDPGVSVEALLERVRVRFPDLDFGDVTHVQLSRALKDAGYPLSYDVVAHVFRGPRRSHLPSTGLPSHTSTSAPGSAAREAPAARLAEAVGDGGFRALTVRVRHLPGLAGAVAGRFPVAPVDVNAEFLACFRELAAENGQDWAKVLRIDGQLSVAPGSTPPSGYAGYVAEVAKRLAVRWNELATARPRTVLFLHNAGLLARYWDIAGRTLLTELQHAARRPREAPHGLWLLCPAENPMGSPQLDGRLVETVVPDGEWIVMTSGMVDWLVGEERSGE